MKHTVYFLISPKIELVSQIKVLSGSELSDLWQPIIWSGSEFDKASLQHSDLDILTKILFLDTLRRERGSEVEFSKIFPKFIISVNYFNSLWSIQRIKLDMSVEIAIEDAIESGTINSIERTNNERVDDLLSLYSSKKL